MKHFSSILVLLFCLFTFTNLSATLPTGSSAPGLSVTDIGGGSHDIYGDYLGNGISVAVDMSATWCGPCWSFHNSGTFDDIYSDYGPSSGDFKVMPIMVEIDPGTNQNCFYGMTGCNDFTFGDWSQGGPFPKCNPPSGEASGIASDWNVTNLPVIYVIAPSGYIKAFVGSSTDYSDIEAWGAETFQMENSTWQVNSDPCGAAHIDFQPVGGYGTIYYNWSNGATTEDLNNLSTGDYWVTISDDNNYQVEFGPISVTAVDPISLITISTQSVDCYGENSGSIEVEAMGGSGSFSYNWSNGANGSFITGLVADDYDVTVVDNSTACEAFGAYSIGEPDELEATFDVTSAGCGGTTGTVEFDVYGGTEPYSFIIDGNYYSDPFITLPAGYYETIIEDANLCELEVEFEIEQFPLPDAMGIASGDFDCSSSAVFVEAFGSSTGSHINYAWYDENGTYITDAYTFQVNNPGDYQLYVTDTNTNCSNSALVPVIGNIQQPTASTTYSNNLTCTQPTANLVGSGSSAGSQYSYEWTTSDGSFASGTSGINATANSAGTYTLSVTDNNNSCTSSSSVTLSGATNPTFAMSGATTFCAGSSSNLCVTAGNDESVTWYYNGQVLSTNNCYAANTAGTYTAVLTNNVTGCSTTQTIETTINALPVIDLPATHSFCEGSSVVICHNADPSVNYAWNMNSIALGSAQCITVNQVGTLQIAATHNLTGCSNNFGTQISMTPSPSAELLLPDGSEINCTTNVINLDLNTATGTQVSWTDQNGNLLSSSEDITATAAGTYYYQVTSSAGCITYGQTTITESNLLPEISIAQPAMITCDNDQIMLVLTTDNSGYTITWTDSAGNVLSQQEDIIVTNPGTYLATAETSTGCISTTSVSVGTDYILPVINIAQPAMLTCENDQVTLDLTTDNSNYTITWTDAAGNLLSQNEDLIVTEAGSYTALVEGNGECSSTATAQVIADESLPEFTIAEIEPITCLTESTLVNLIPQESGYTYTWYDRWGGVISEEEDSEMSEPGIYLLVVTNTAGCEVRTDVAVPGDMAAPSLTTETPEPLDCNNSSSVLTVISDSAPLEIIWTNVNGSIVGTSERITVTSAGVYTALVTSQNGCSSSIEVTLNQIDNQVIYSEFSSSGDDLSFSFDNTSADNSMTTNYYWDFGDGNTSTEVHPEHEYAEPGTYQVCLTTENECGATTQCNDVMATVSALQLSGEHTNVSCYGGHNGTISLVVEGGLGMYEYAWNESDLTGQSLNGLMAGNYSVTVTDQNNNSNELSFTLTEPTQIVVFGETTASTDSPANGTIEIAIAGGVAPYEIVWEDGSSETERTDLAPGMYLAKITDANGCEVVSAWEVELISRTNEVRGLADLTIHPNPASSQLTIEGRFDKTTSYEIYLVNALGQKEALTKEISDVIEQKVNVSQFPAGLYSVELRVGKQVSTRKLVIVR